MMHCTSPSPANQSHFIVLASALKMVWSCTLTFSLICSLSACALASARSERLLTISAFTAGRSGTSASPSGGGGAAAVTVVSAMEARLTTLYVAFGSSVLPLSCSSTSISSSIV